MLDQMRAARPDIALSGDFIVGFPGETEEDFDATLQHRRCGRLRRGLFVQVQRPSGHSGGSDGGPDSARGDGRRLQRLQARINEHSLAFNRSKVGRDTRILIERKGRRDGQMIGKSPWLQSVHVETDARPGDMLDVTLVAAGPNSLTGAVRQRGPPDGPPRPCRRPPTRARLELEFEQPYLLGPLFGDYDRHLITIEQRLGVHIAARGNRVQIEGEPDAAARARDVLIGLYNRLDHGHDVDAEAVEAVLGMAAQPHLDGIITGRSHLGADGHDPDAQEDHRPALDRPDRRTWRRSPAKT